MKFAILSILYVVAGSGLMLHGITQPDPDTVLAGTGLLLLSFVLLVASSTWVFVKSLRSLVEIMTDLHVACVAGWIGTQRLFRQTQNPAH